jgi:hypothetical protein
MLLRDDVSGEGWSLEAGERRRERGWLYRSPLRRPAAAEVGEVRGTLGRVDRMFASQPSNLSNLSPFP